MSSSPSLRAASRVLRGGDAQLFERASVTTPLSDLVFDEPVVAPAVPNDPIADAYRAGIAAGRAEAEADFVREEADRRGAALNSLVAALTDAATTVARSREALMDQVISEIGDLVLALVRELVSEELALRDDPARAAIERALRFAPPDIDLVVHLNPGDEIAAWELESLVPGRRIRVVEDDHVEAGGCVLEVGSARIDAQIGPALERLHTAFTHLQVVPDLEEEAG